MDPRITPTTIWSILDYFLRELASNKDKICEKSTINSPLYLKLIALVCKNEISDEVLELIKWKPYYPFILLSYYMLFHKRNLTIAGTIYHKLKEMYERYPFSFDTDEEYAFKVLDIVVKELEILSKMSQNKYKGKLYNKFYEIILKIKEIKYQTRNWSKLFKFIILSHLDPKNASQYIEEILNEKSYFDVIDEEIAEAYNLIETNRMSVTYEFLEKIARSVKENIDGKFKELNELDKEKKKIEKKLRLLERFTISVKNIKDLSNNISVVGSILSLIASYSISLFIGISEMLIIIIMLIIVFILGIPNIAFFIYYKPRLRKIDERINNWVEDYIFKDMYEAIWPNNK